MAQNEFSFAWNSDNKVYFGTAAPTSGTYAKGDIVVNSAPSAGSVMCWICTAAGSPGTFKAVAPIDGPYTLGTLSSTLATITGLVNTTMTSGTATISAGAATLATGNIAALTTTIVGGIATLTSGVITTGTIAGGAATLTTGQVTNLTNTNQTTSGTKIDTPATIQTLTAATAITTAGHVLPILAGSQITITQAPTIADGTTGQEIELINVGSNTILIQDQGSLASSNLRLETAALTLAARHSVKLRYNGTVGDWVQSGGQVSVI